MNRKAKIWMSVGVAAAVATAAGTAMAATSQTAPTAQTQDAQQSTPAHGQGQHVEFKGGGNFSAVLDLLKIDNATLKQELSSGKSLADIAAAKGVDKQQLIDKLTQQRTQEIDQAVKDGKLAQAKADQIKTSLGSQITKMVDQKGGAFEKHDDKGERGGKQLDAVASLLKMTNDELLAQLKAGKSISDVAKEKGVTEQQVIDTLMQQQKDSITKFVQKKGFKSEQKGKADQAAPSTSSAANNS